MVVNCENVQYADSTFLRLLAESKSDVFIPNFKHEQGCDNSSQRTQVTWRPELVSADIVSGFLWHIIGDFLYDWRNQRCLCEKRIRFRADNVSILNHWLKFMKENDNKSADINSFFYISTTLINFSRPTKSQKKMTQSRFLVVSFPFPYIAIGCDLWWDFLRRRGIPGWVLCPLLQNGWLWYIQCVKRLMTTCSSLVIVLLFVFIMSQNISTQPGLKPDMSNLLFL
jgi:hypothetical protein